jgi:uncharacterized protein (DUF1778 family)
MALKSMRIELRTDPDTEARIARAAALQGMSITAFVRGAAERAADRVLGEADQTMMPAEQFDGLMTSLDAPDRAPRLREVAQRQRAFGRL